MNWNYDACISIFKREISLLEKLSLVQDSVHQAVMAREWTDFDWKIAEINQLGEEFALLDKERVQIFDALKEKCTPQMRIQDDKEPSFYSMAMNLPTDECRELSELFRLLKMDTLKFKIQNETFTSYLNEVKNITAAWLEAVFPSQGGRLYTMKGHQVSGEPQSMILNHRV
ncbi:MAG: hypothetical protein FWF22_07510 [Treponema sp.]|nr:hypothetical protein [Treponema sp.]